MSPVTPRGASHRHPTTPTETTPSAEPAAVASIHDRQKTTASFLSDPAEQPVSMVFTPLDQHGRPQQALRITLDPRTGETVTTTLDGQEVDPSSVWDGELASATTSWSGALRVLRALRAPAPARAALIA